MKPLSILVLTALLPAFAAPASEQLSQEAISAVTGALPYSVFETSIVHTDLTECPSGYDPEKMFCRLTLANDQAHIFVFDYEGDQPLVAVRHYEVQEPFISF